ncbi:K+/H+ antiporter subunit F [Crenalkalicoccus roseus]|uniref:K+/H+ antiporter subunit F n=1 Tax=Crenalkalicoccus roseus TaxID=1485588 RepID=UPI001081DA65|nr:K+/H+ antiporter subunit F [Crenalkalicoccus roseus]
MIMVACAIALAVVAAGMLLNLYRLAAGPDALDRVLALDTMAINAIALVMLLGIWFETHIYFEAALLIAAVGFLATVAFCKYLLRGNVIG